MNVAWTTIRSDALFRYEAGALLEGLYDAVESLYRERGRGEFPIYNTAALAERPLPPRVEGVGVERRDSGALEVFWAEPWDRSPGFARFAAEIALDLARGEDERVFEEEASPAVEETQFDGRSEVTPLVFRSVLPDVEAATLGPGGRVSVYAAPAGRGSLQADIVVRRRGRAIPSRAREPGAILREVVEEVDLYAPSEIHVAFGYVELSKFDRQEWMRPAFVFVADRRPGDASPGWRTTRIVPATTADDLALSDGLGDWFL